VSTIFLRDNTDTDVVFSLGFLFDTNMSYIQRRLINIVIISNTNSFKKATLIRHSQRQREGGARGLGYPYNLHKSVKMYEKLVIFVRIY
jgi:hypothetical protein